MSLGFSGNWLKLKENHFTTIRLADKRKWEGRTLEITTPSARFYAKVLKVQRIKIGVIPIDVLAKDFDYSLEGVSEKGTEVYDAFCKEMMKLNHWHMYTHQQTNPDYKITEGTEVSLITLEKVAFKTLMAFVEELA